MTTSPIQPGFSQLGSRPAVGRREQAVRQLKQYILEHGLKPGDPLPTENELCEALGTSRSSVREAVRTLAALDIVEVRHGHGTYVGTLSLNALLESLAFKGMLDHSDEGKVLTDVIEVRRALEEGLAYTLCHDVSPDVTARLAELAEVLVVTGSRGETAFAEDRQFHLTLVGAVGNELAMQLTAVCWDVHAIVAPRRDPSTDELVESAHLHVAMVEALRRGDDKALRVAIAAHYQPILQRMHHVS